MVSDKADDQAEQQWIEQIRARGWGDAFSTALDVLEPLGLIGAQLLWVAQPAARLFGGWDSAIGAMARALEEPGGVERLRQALEQQAAEGQAFDNTLDNQDLDA